jgi:hypothetical protein
VSRTIWIDLDNAPHVVTFAPLIEALEAAGARVALTARDVNDTPRLAQHFGLAPRVSGSAFGAGFAGKVMGTLLHGATLAASARRVGAGLALSHGSRSQAVACLLRRTPCAVMFDYENADLRIFRRAARRFYYPAALEEVVRERYALPLDQCRPYPGLKEHLALLTLKGETAQLEAAGIPVEERLAVVRPESDTAHYLDGRPDDTVLEAALDQCRRWQLRPVLVPRSAAQRQRLARMLDRYPETVVPSQPVTGMDLLERARLLVSGGGTMNREAVVLGLPVISMFRGRLGHLDQAFIDEGRMVHAPTDEALRRLDEIPSPPPRTDPQQTASHLRDWLVEHVLRDLHDFAR